MVTHQEIQRQLKALGEKFTWWGRGEANELEHVIEPGESIMYCLNGRYEAGFCMLCISDKRLLLIDKKPMYLNLEDIKFDKISEVDFQGRMVESAVIINSAGKRIWFSALKGDKLRRATAYLQRKVMESKQPSFAQIAQPYLLQGQPVATNEVKSLEHTITNPYTRLPIVMRRRLSRFHN